MLFWWPVTDRAIKVAIVMLSLALIVSLVMLRYHPAPKQFIITIEDNAIIEEVR